MTIYLIQCGQTDYQGEGRLQGRLSLPLSAAGQQQCQRACEQLDTTPVEAVYAPADEACLQTAKAIVKGRRGCKVRKLQGLQELDLGLWQGAAVEELKRRQPKVYRLWLEQPLTVTPPQGESFETAYHRVAEAVEGALARHRGEEDAAAIVLVLPPLAVALARCYLGHYLVADIWTMVRAQPDPAGPERFEVEPVRP